MYFSPKTLDVRTQCKIVENCSAFIEINITTYVTDLEYTLFIRT